MKRALFLLISLVSACVLYACGGGTDVAGVGSGGSGLAGGTVSGFGSVYVDGVEIEDALSANVVENADGSLSNVSFKLGQRVRVELGTATAGTATASRIDVQAGVVGSISSLSTNGFRVAGQTVTVNLQTGSATLTAFGGGYLSLANAAVGDWVEVHGTPLATADGGSTLQASRIDRLGTASAVLTARVMGTVSHLDTAAGSFAINSLTVRTGSATLAPAGAALANGQSVIAWGTLGSGDAPVLGAARIRVLGMQPPALNGGDTSQVRLKGAIGSFLSAASFVVRNVPVDASAIDLAAACPGVTLASGSVVEITARRQAGTDVVKATSLLCPAPQQQSRFTAYQHQGTATTVLTSAQSFSLALPTGGTQAVRWTAQTVFRGLAATTLQGMAVVVDGYLDAGVVVAREIRVPGQQESDRFDPRNGTGAWDRYDDTFRPPPPPGGPR